MKVCRWQCSYGNEVEIMVNFNDKKEFVLALASDRFESDDDWNSATEDDCHCHHALTIPIYYKINCVWELLTITINWIHTISKGFIYIFWAMLEWKIEYEMK